MELTGLSEEPNEKGELDADVLGAPNAAWPRGLMSALGAVSGTVVVVLELEPSEAVIAALGWVFSLSYWLVISAR